MKNNNIDAHKIINVGFNSTNCSKKKNHKQKKTSQFVNILSILI